MGGIWNVGRASTVPPRLVILKYTPEDAAQAAAPPIGIVGKGIVRRTIIAGIRVEFFQGCQR